MSKKKIPETTLAWLAALIDGEGPVMLVRRVASKTAKIQRNPHYRAPVVISNTDLRLLREVVKKTGIDRVYLHVRPPNARNAHHHRKSYTWRMVASEIRVWLPLLLPWLVIKRKQAKLLLRALEIAAENTPWQGQSYNYRNLDERDRIYEAIREINSGHRRRCKDES